MATECSRRGESSFCGQPPSLPDRTDVLWPATVGADTRPVTRFDNSRPSAQQKRESPVHDEDAVKEIVISEGRTCLYNKDRTFLYLGEVSQAKNNRVAFPDGTGIVRQATILAEEDSISCEYCLCSWKRGSRHGSGLLMRPDGTIVKAVWKWDRLKSVAPEPPGDEEIDLMESRIEELTALLSLLGR